MAKIPCRKRDHSHHYRGAYWHNCRRCGKEILWAAEECFDCRAKLSGVRE